jgi:hypothetical protein
LHNKVLLIQKLVVKYSQWIGICGALILIIACFLPWAYYPDLDKTFSGFFSEKNMYGKPGKFLTFFSVIGIALFLAPKIWAKRTNLFIAAIILAFAIKSFILFSGCYSGICPDKRAGIFLIIAGPVLMVVAAMFPDLKITDKKS